MKRRLMTGLLALALGWTLPRLLFALGSRRELEAEQTEAVQMAEQTAQTEPQQTLTASVLAVDRYIPVIQADGGIVVMELEEYIRGVVLAEMPASFETEALKAQAVAARTYALRHCALADRHSEGAVCTDSGCCQAYIRDSDYLAGRGTQADLDKVSSAVADTAGEVLTYGGELIEATYFACSGGRTEDAAAVWGSDIPYLQAVDSPGEIKASAYDENLYFTGLEFAALLGRNLTGSPESWLGEARYTDGGGVATMVIAGMTYTGTQLRSLLGLNSTVLTMTADSAGVAVSTQGWGHRVGMSQYGADAMAVSGSSYTEILTYYYQGTTIDKIGAIG